ncbi:endonuclease/exonuclease/phosphatase (EEP) superfamily protein YafD [Flavobacterium sp. PL11]|uniref:endonuclease/exonuclease/phosphatase family protein n=1 Tax=Flavobacterium sp. PL11 TaxID=3071717 RepID=UPI002E0C3A06|nr:endonuclease/exonuclease/phosphatase (EEP) superfamily protein YafD [Flavobacterium sp. PL11]
MKKIYNAFYTLFYVIVVLLAIGSILSIFRDTDSRYLKYLDFPRIQFFIISIILLIIAAIVIKKWLWYDYLLSVLLCIGLIINGSYLINYTVFVSKKVPTAMSMTGSDVKFSLLLSNVKMTNKKTKPLLDLVEKMKPDLVLTMEVNEWWNKKLKVLEGTYPYSQQTINEVTYGMILFSKFPLQNLHVNYLQNKNVPSFEMTLVLPNDQKIIIHAIHPVPPTHFKNLPDNKGQNEKVLDKLGQKIIRAKLPVLVAGDFNDVVWSHVNKITGTEDILFDVRVGRGFYNSFDAENFLIRWPLDHIFVTKEFRLNRLERLKDIGSDHFPMFVELVL